MRLVAISDTHGRVADLELPAGDVLVHAGDATMGGTLDEVESFSRWFSARPHRHKVFVAGNHDRLFQLHRDLAQRILGPAITYLRDSPAIIEGIMFYGSPWTPWFNDWAFNLERGVQIRERWDRIPYSTEVLVTHGPPAGVLDRTGPGKPSKGCEDLGRRLNVVKPRLHLFGHIHGGHGVEVRAHTTFGNASVCDEEYRPVNQPLCFDRLADGGWARVEVRRSVRYWEDVWPGNREEP